MELDPWSLGSGSYRNEKKKNRPLETGSGQWKPYPASGNWIRLVETGSDQWKPDPASGNRIRISCNMIVTTTNIQFHSFRTVANGVS